jgi:hypothetical protein
MHAGWPKAVQRAVGVSTGPDASVAIFIWMPLNATTPNATVSVVTDYPFGDSATVTVTPTRGKDVNVALRIPSWAAGATLSVNGGAAVPLVGSNGAWAQAALILTEADEGGGWGRA